MSNVNLSVTGYFGTGSSAVIELLKEYEGCLMASPIQESYEHMAFYSKGALFDFASIILSPYISAYTSDQAVNGFIEAAERLNDNDFGWYGSYSKYYGSRYMEIVQTFIGEIASKRNRKSASHVKKVAFSPIQLILQVGASIVYRRKIHKWGRKYIYDGKNGYVCLPSKKEFCMAAKKYTSSYIEMCSNKGEVNIFDHLLWPQQINSLADLFENLKVIIVDRDPRDVYLLNKYFWSNPSVASVPPFFPTNASDFIDEWKRTVVPIVNTNDVLHVKFEDLVYNLDDTVIKIEKFVGIKSASHLKKKAYFDPQESIENTQIFNVSEEWRKEVEPIEKELNSYIYRFPYQRTPNKSKWFDR